MFRKVLALFLLLLALAGGICYYLYSELHSSKEHPNSDQHITLDYGSSPSQIIEVLEQESIIKTDFPLKVYFRLINRNPNLQAGDYLFP